MAKFGCVLPVATARINIRIAKLLGAVTPQWRTILSLNKDTLYETCFKGFREFGVSYFAVYWLRLRLYLGC